MQHLFAFHMHREAQGIAGPQLVANLPSNAFRAHSVNEARIQLRNGLLNEVRRIHTLHLRFCQLLLVWVDMMSEYPSIAAVTERMRCNQVLEQLRKAPSFLAQVESHGPFWTDYLDLVTSWYHQCLCKETAFVEYCSHAYATKQQDLAVLLAIVEMICSNKKLQSFFSFQTMDWLVDKNLAKRLTEDRLHMIADGVIPNFSDETRLMSHGDNSFYQQLVESFVEHEAVHRELIAAQLHHWSWDRIAFLDRVMLQMALCELRYFVDIPHSVTIDTYMNLAKQYSTSKSHTFLNGILDTLWRSMLRSTPVPIETIDVVDLKLRSK